MNNNTSCLFLGAGYTAKCMMQQMQSDNIPQTQTQTQAQTEAQTQAQIKTHKMWGTTRSGRNFGNIKTAGAQPLLFEGTHKSEPLSAAIRQAHNILISISPKEEGDIVLLHHGEDIKANKNLTWVGYLSTVGVYGNHDGAWVTEDSTTNPSSERSQWRQKAERQWLELHQETGLPVHIFRLPGIYGPGRGPQKKLKAGTARRINKKGQVFNRAHVDDIAATLIASMQKPNPGAIYNIADDEPAPPQDVLAYAADLMGIDPLPLIPFEKAEMTQMAKSFYTDNKRVSNKRIKEELGVTLKYPTYKEGIKACL